MAGATTTRTRYPGVYKRGSRYEYRWTDAGGTRRRSSADTLEQARASKADREREAREGTPVVAVPGRLTLARYARELYGADLDRPADREPMRGRYVGRRGAVRDTTREQYRGYMERFWLPSLGARALETLTAADLRRVIDGLTSRDGDAYMADNYVRRIFAGVSALMATAAEEGLVPFNVARDVTLPSGRDRLRTFAAGLDDEQDEPQAKAMTREQLAAFLLIVDPRHGTFFRLLASTGLRISEAVALRWRDLTLDGSTPHLRVRRGYVRGVYGPPKSQHSRRSVPLAASLVSELRVRKRDTEWPGDGELVFATAAGTPLVDVNLRKRTLVPAAQEAGVPWAGFHTFRHTCGSLLIAEGRNIVQVSRWLGHHSPAFTLTVYAHLLDDGVGAAMEVPNALEGAHGGHVAECEAVRSSPPA